MDTEQFDGIVVGQNQLVVAQARNDNRERRRFDDFFNAFVVFFDFDVLVFNFLGHEINLYHQQGNGKADINQSRDIPHRIENSRRDAQQTADEQNRDAGSQETADEKTGFEPMAALRPETGRNVGKTGQRKNLAHIGNHRTVLRDETEINYGNQPQNRDGTDDRRVRNAGNQQLRSRQSQKHHGEQQDKQLKKGQDINRYTQLIIFVHLVAEPGADKLQHQTDEQITDALADFDVLTAVPNGQHQDNQRHQRYQKIGSRVKNLYTTHYITPINLYLLTSILYSYY